MAPDTHSKLVNAVTAYDRRGQHRKGWNPYALPQYFRAIDNAAEAMREGVMLRAALASAFTGRLLDVCLKAVGEAPSTDREQRS